ncbi:MAG: hypothetical protein Fur005_07880 [Roseiflexaceae bacterium]
MNYQTTIVAELIVIEGWPDLPMLRSAADIDRIIEICFAEGSNWVLLHASNMPDEFFDLSSGQAGIMLQKLRNYRIRCALVCPPSIPLSRRFGEMVADERNGTWFGMWPERSQALAWIERVISIV